MMKSQHLFSHPARTIEDLRTYSSYLDHPAMINQGFHLFSSHLDIRMILKMSNHHFIQTPHPRHLCQTLSNPRGAAQYFHILFYSSFPICAFFPLVLKISVKYRLSKASISSLDQFNPLWSLISNIDTHCWSLYNYLYSIIFDASLITNQLLFANCLSDSWVLDSSIKCYLVFSH